MTPPLASPGGLSFQDFVARLTESAEFDTHVPHWISNADTPRPKFSC